MTKELREWAKRSKQGIMEQWAAGEFSAAFELEMLVKNAGATGACSIYDLIIEMDEALILGEDK